MSKINVAVSGSSILYQPSASGKNDGSLYEMSLKGGSSAASQFIFPTDSIVVFEFTKPTLGGETANGYTANPEELSGDSRLVKITVYENALAYSEGKVAYYYQPQNPDGTNISSSPQQVGDTYLGFQTNGFADQNKPPVIVDPNFKGSIPKLGSEMLIMPAINLYEELVVKGTEVKVTNISSVDLDGDGVIGEGEKGNGFFTAGRLNDHTEDSYVTPNLPVPCYLAGTKILTEAGEVAVDDLKIGDMVVTADHGPQPIRWIGSRKLSLWCLRANEKLRPIRIKAHSFGALMPSRDLLVSPQHRILIRGDDAQRLTGQREVMLAAKFLLPLSGVEVATDLQEVEYFHILFDHHEIVLANGTPSESLYAGPGSLTALSRDSREAIQRLYPEQDWIASPAMPARPFLKGKLAKRLIECLAEKLSLPRAA